MGFFWTPEDREPRSRGTGGKWDGTPVVVEVMGIVLYAHIKTAYFSTENSSSLEADNHFKPSPRPRSMLKRHNHKEEKEGLGEDKTTALREELEARSAPSPLPKLSDRQLEAEKKSLS